MRHSVFVMAVLMLVLFASHAIAQEWWNEAWQYRKKITFDTTADGADIKENLADVPMLVRLHTGNFNFANCKGDGTDIRFVGGDGLTPLKHHIELFDPIDEMALIWVKVPRLAAASKADFILMYYGNETAMGGQDARGTYDVNQLAVYHLGEVEGLPQDVTAYENHAVESLAGQGLPSIIGRGFLFSGGGEYIRIPSSPPLEFSGGLTFSAWLRIPQPQEDAYLFSREDGDNAVVVGIEGTKLYGRVTVAGETVETEKTADLSPQAWHHVAVTAVPGGRMTVYVDGLEMTWAQLQGDLPSLETDIALGSSLVEGSEGHGFVGDLDEVRLSNTARTLGWIRAAFEGQGSSGTLTGYGVESIHEGGGLPTFYLGTIAKNITLDGLVVIGILAIFAVLSWLVFLGKAFSLFVQGRSNRGFQREFQEAEDLLALDSEEEEIPNSSLYRVYQAGCREVREWLSRPGALVGNPEPVRRPIPEGVVDGVKASLEAAFVEETKRLNAWIVILTMAITGGPFLGLLGTVWGVMNTFAAMAEAGEANIMAIAPGVASALSTTVFGLIVAIPALFAYNYLNSRIKNITSDLAVFVDRFALHVKEHYGEAV
jgi:biopolymer transport protein ExbB